MNMLGLLFSFIGVGMVVLNGSFRFDANPLGVGLESMAVIAAIAYSIVLKSLAHRYNTLTIIVITSYSIHYTKLYEFLNICLILLLF